MFDVGAGAREAVAFVCYNSSSLLRDAYDPNADRNMPLPLGLAIFDEAHEMAVTSSSSSDGVDPRCETATCQSDGGFRDGDAKGHPHQAEPTGSDRWSGGRR